MSETRIEKGRVCTVQCTLCHLHLLSFLYIPSPPRSTFHTPHSNSSSVYSRSCRVSPSPVSLLQWYLRCCSRIKSSPSTSRPHRAHQDLTDTIKASPIPRVRQRRLSLRRWCAIHVWRQILLVCGGVVHAPRMIVMSCCSSPTVGRVRHRRRGRDKAFCRLSSAFRAQSVLGRLGPVSRRVLIVADVPLAHDVTQAVLVFASSRVERPGLHEQRVAWVERSQVVEVSIEFF